MGVLTVSEMSDIALDRIQGNVSVDAPFTPAEVLRRLNDAKADIKLVDEVSDCSYPFLP